MVNHPNSDKKTCFVISPIGKPGDETRLRSNIVFKRIIKPACKTYNIEPIRADLISSSGNINIQVIEHLHNSDLVIADLSDRNPNVFYEMAIRHSIFKYLIPMILDDEELPFDVNHDRTLKFSLLNIKYITEARDSLKKKIIDFLNNEPMDTPISIACASRYLPRFISYKPPIRSTTEEPHHSAKQKQKVISRKTTTSAFGWIIELDKDPFRKIAKMQHLINTYGIQSNSKWFDNPNSPYYIFMKDSESNDMEFPFTIGDQVYIFQHFSYEPYFHQHVGKIDSKGSIPHSYQVRILDVSKVGIRGYHAMYLTKIKEVIEHGAPMSQ